MTPALFTRALYEALLPIDLLPATREIVIAQGALESGWGKSLVSRSGFNHWNLTAGKSWRGPVIGGGDLEYPPDGGPPVRIRQRFRRYGSHHEAVVDYFAFLRGFRRYARALDALLLGKDGEFLTWLRNDDPATAEVEGGFFTAPLADYRLGFLRCLADVRRLLAAREAVA